MKKVIRSLKFVLKMAKVFQSYHGGKGGTGVYQTIINQIPPHRIYVELFLGNGTIFQRKQQAEINILSDLSPTVVESWIGSGICFECVSHFGIWKGVTIYQLEAIQLLNIKRNILDVPGSFIFLDPPYPFSVRKDKAPVYEFELSNQQHNALLEVVSSYHFANIMISSYPNQMYDDALTDWRKIDFQGQTRRGKVTERIYMNYPEPEELHDYGYIGKNYRDRWRIEKKTRNIISKFKKMPPLERKAILEAVYRDLKAEVTTKL